MENQILDDQLSAPDLHLSDANKGKRFANFLIDYVITIILSVPILWMMFYTSPDYLDAPTTLGERLVGILLYFVYYTLIEGLTGGKSIGKYITRTRVVMQNGDKPAFSTFAVRSVCRIVPFEAFSFLGSKATGWHDDWSKTRVIDEVESTLPRAADYV
jgi:uncharacterized RDD family membrane protein YckC